MITEFLLNKALDVMEPFCYTPDHIHISREQITRDQYNDAIILKKEQEAKDKAKSDAITRIKNQLFY